MSRDAFHDPNNPYASPESSLAPDLGIAGVTGGTLEATLAGQTTWTIGEVLNDAWQLVSGFKGTFWLAVLMIFGAQLVVNLVMAGMVAVTRSQLVATIVGFALSVAVLWPLQFGMMMLAVKRAAGVETKASMVGDYFPRIPEIAGLFILQSLMIGLGFLLLIIPGIYLAVSYILAPQMLLDRRLGIWNSLEMSRRAIGTCWFKTFGLILVMIPISLLIPLTLGIGLVWIAPMLLLVLGVLYQRLAGYTGGDVP